MPISGLSRTYSCQDISSHNVQETSQNQLGASLNNVRSSSVRLSRSLSCSLPNLTHISSGPADIKNSSLELARFESVFEQKALQDLFDAGPDGNKKNLERLFFNSSNTYAKLEIMAFAKVFSQLLSQLGVTAENRTALNQLAQNYNRQILRDGLGEKSGFAAWTASTRLRYAQRSKLEHQLAALAEQYSAGDVLKLGAGFMVADVMPYIQQCLEQQLGAKLNSITRQRLPELVDKAAMRAFDALRTERVKLINQRGMGLGKLARDLDTVAALPRLLRDLLSALAEAPQNAKPKPSLQPEAAVPPENKAGGGFTLHGGIHIDNHQVDNSQHTFNLNINVSGAGSMPTPLVQNLNLGREFQPQGNTADRVDGAPNVASERDEQRLEDPLQEKARRVTEKVRADSELLTSHVSAGMAKPIQSSATGLFNAARDVATQLSNLLEVTNAAVADNAKHHAGQTPNAEATERADSVLLTSRVSADVAKPISNPAIKPLHGSRDVAVALSSLLDVTTEALGHQRDSRIQPASRTSASSQPAGDTESAQNVELKRISSDYGRLKFRRANLNALPSQAYLRSTGGQFNAEHELLKAVRSILEVDTNQPWSIRRDFEQLRNRLLPNYESDRSQLLQAVSNKEKQQGLQQDMDVLQELLANHSGLAAGRSAVQNFARTLLRETDLCRQGKQPNPLITALLDGIAGTGENRWHWRADASRQQPATVAEKVVLTTDGLHFDPTHR
ncbi:hypothetical protein [Aeromonas cavernicola]|uniref:Uncharacterized protein n=1 Tax=Aeromonas cavernicola TaxID=1006623 RepID=A0A2H9U8Z8_9GAMM|nr:hypothetical protein [Aeromonas cavernicola]PJG60478.1 hypothetical protein CUC53_01705 [Aeromonas cavernicola]